ncbi:hypothetical protein D9758_012246 [Tetrapyrgos nigripes]|uniref:Uncharacterized protein n=1 Tax=Tetrapyrgos nigripes TaxID=182062 RepID=A0A8H5FJ90_9AGAR|nr:hypothetical protein D9758_012246 [Tetrapyrgos nigripes]
MPLRVRSPGSEDNTRLADSHQWRQDRSRTVIPTSSNSPVVVEQQQLLPQPWESRKLRRVEAEAVPQAFITLSTWLQALNPKLLLLITMLSYFTQQVLAQAPVNDVISWPPGLLLLATVLYAALGTTSERLFAIEPVAGLFLFSGLPMISLSGMRKVTWVAKACHFVSGIRTAHGKYNFWIRADDITSDGKTEALEKVTDILHCVVWEDVTGEFPSLDEDLWVRMDGGMIRPRSWPPVMQSDSTTPVDLVDAVKPPPHNPPPKITPHDFLLWAAIEYHAFHEWEVEIRSHGSSCYSTKGKPANTVVDVENEEAAIQVVAAQMVRRPHSQSPLRALATRKADGEPYVLDLDQINLDATACYIDFHSYAPESAKVSASLRELAHSYFVVTQHIKQHASTWSGATAPEPGTLARIKVGQSLWIAILSGALLENGRVTFQNLAGRWSCRGASADEAYLTRLDAILGVLRPYANTPEFFDLVFSGGLSRRTCTPFLIAGIIGQIIICYFISVGTTAGVWTSVALANTLFAGRLVDWHSVWFGKTADSSEPGFKMYVPGTKDLMCIATLNRTSPREGELRQGFLLNAFGLAAAICGAIFAVPTRNALGFGSVEPSATWVSYTSIGLCVGTSLLVATTVISQQVREKTWFDDSEMPTRWVMFSTVPVSLAIAGLALLFEIKQLHSFWPILDALTWVSGVPLAMLENGRMVSMDENYLHLVLLNRWIMGAVASSIGSNART